MVISVRVPESGVWYVRDVLYAVLYVRVSCFVVRGCGVSRRYIDVCGGAISASKYKFSTFVGFRHPVMARHADSILDSVGVHKPTFPYWCRIFSSRVA